MSDPIIFLLKAAKTGVNEMTLADLVTAVADALPPPDESGTLGFGIDDETSSGLTVGIKAGFFRGNSGQTFFVAAGSAVLEDFTSNQYIYVETNNPAHTGEFRVTTNADHGGVGLWKFTTDSGAITGGVDAGQDMRATLSAPACFQITLDDENAKITVPSPASLGMIGQRLSYYAPTLTGGHFAQFTLGNIVDVAGSPVSAVVINADGEYVVFEGWDATTWRIIRAAATVVT